MQIIIDIQANDFNHTLSLIRNRFLKASGKPC